jgi:hypothetical protein
MLARRELIKEAELRVTVKSLLCLSGGALQNIAAFLQERRFVEMLELRLQLDPALQFSAGVLFSRHLKGYGEPCHAVAAEFDRITGPLVKRLE